MLTRGLYSPLGIAIQVLMLAGLVLLVRVDWAAVLARIDRRRRAREGQGDPPTPGITH